MDKDNILERLLAIIEHPEEYGEEDINALLDDPAAAEYYGLIVRAKQALTAVKPDEEINTPDINKEWRAFEGKHLKHEVSVWRKAVAACLAVLLISGAAFATIRIAKRAAETNNTTQTEITDEGSNDGSSAAFGTETNPADSLSQEVIVFDNEEVANVMNYLETRFGVSVSYKDEEVKHIRLYLQLSPDDGIDGAVDLLNHFENISVTRQDNTLTVE